MRNDDYLKNAEIERVAWNLSQAIIAELQKLLTASSVAYLKKDFPKMFSCLKAVKLRVISNLDKAERETLKSMEGIIEKNMGVFDFLSTELLFDHDELTVKKARSQAMRLIKKIEDYNEIVMDLLEKYGFLISKSDDKTNLNR